jgi:hypothetical protein
VRLEDDYGRVDPDGAAGDGGKVASSS